jgi:hypothetical protein
VTRGRRLLTVLSAAVATLAVLPAGPFAPVHSHAATAHPSLLFSATDVPAMQQAILAGEDAKAWARLEQKVDSYTDPTSPNYVDPSLIANPDPVLFPNWHGYDGLLGQNQMGTYLIDLGLAYQLSGNARYGNAAIALMLGEAAANWPSWGDAGGEPGLGRGDLLRGVGFAFDWTYTLMTAAQRLTIVQALTNPNSAILCGSDANATSCDSNGGNPGSNHSTIGPGGTGIALMAVSGEPGVYDPTDLSARLQRTRDRVLAGMQASFGVNGDDHEGILYSAYGLHTEIPFSQAWKRTMNEDLLALAPNVANAPLWLAHEQLPGRGLEFVPRNDSGTRPQILDEVLPTLFAVRNDGVTGWLYDNTMGPLGEDVFNTATPYVADRTTGEHDCAPATSQDLTADASCGWTAPEAFTILDYRSPQQTPRALPSTATPLSQHYPEFGLVDMRTGWSKGSDDVVATFEAKRNEQHPGHWQYDLGNFTVYGYGSNFAIDSGYGHNYSCNSNTAIYQGGCPTTEAGSPVGHNVVLVGDDALLPALAHDTTQNNVLIGSTNETIPEYLDGPNMTFLRSDLRSAYSSVVTSVPLAGRDMLFGRAPGEPVLIAVTDTLEPHTGSDSYKWQMHTDGANSVALLGGGARITSPNGAVMLGQVTDAAGTPDLVPTTFDETLYNDFESPPVHTVLTSRTPTTGATQEMDHLAVFAVAPPLTVQNFSTGVPVATGGSIVRVDYNTADIWVASRAATATTVTSGTFFTDWAFAKLTAGSGESMLDQGTTLSYAGITYIQVTGGAATVQVTGSSITANGPTGATYSVYAPQAIGGVVVNGAAVNSCRSGNTVSFPC